MISQFWSACSRRTVPFGALLVVALVGLTGVASAQQARNLRLVTPAGERPDAIFPAFTAAVEARYDYSDAADTPMTLLVYAPGGLRLLRADAVLTGSGTTAVDITGESLMTGLTASLVANSQEMQRSAAQAAGASRGVREYLNGVQAAELLVKTGLRMLRYSALPREATTSLSGLQAALVDMDKLIARARLLDDSDDPGLRGIATQMAGPAGRAVTNAKAFEAVMKDRAANIMPTGKGVREPEGYLLEVLVEGVPAASTHMWVKVPIYLPYSSQP